MHDEGLADHELTGEEQAPNGAGVDPGAPTSGSVSGRSAGDRDAAADREAAVANGDRAADGTAEQPPAETATPRERS